MTKFNKDGGGQQVAEVRRGRVCICPPVKRLHGGAHLDPHEGGEGLVKGTEPSLVGRVNQVQATRLQPYGAHFFRGRDQIHTQETHH